MKAGEICNREVVIIRKDESAFKAAQLMRNYHVGSVVIVTEENGKRKPLGIITDRDLVIELIAKKLDPESFTAEDMVTGRLITADENEDAYEVVQRMKRRGIRRVPIVNSAGYLIGILSLDDLLEFLAEELELLSRIFSSEKQIEEELRE